MFCCSLSASSLANMTYASGPAEWGGVCSSGTRQSPINIPLPAAGPKSAASVRSGPHDFHFSYNRNAAVTVIASGHGTMQVRFVWGSFPRYPLRWKLRLQVLGKYGEA